MPSSVLELRLFGPFEAAVGGARVELPIRKTIALLAFVAIEGRVARSRLADIFWPDLGEDAARRNLRRALHRLRQAGLADHLAADDDGVALVDVTCDVQRFEGELAAGRPGQAVALVRGSFLDGLDLPDAPGFEEWQRAQRESCARRLRGAMKESAAAREGGGDLGGALADYQRLLDADPLNEAAARDAMRIAYLLDRRDEALALYARLQAVLGRELALEPLPQTRALAERIRRSDPLQTEVAAAKRDVALAAEIPLVGREREAVRLADSSQEIVIVAGDPGVGKTRLASDVVAQLVSGQPIVVRFTELSSSIPLHAIAEALRSEPGRSALETLDPAVVADLARLLPELAVSAAEHDAATGGATPAEARTRLLEAAARALSAAAPVVMFDDLHWADASSLALLLHLGHRRRQQPETFARCIATLRTHEAAARSELQAMLADAGRAGLIREVSLAPLDDWAVMQLIHHLSGAEGGARFARRLAQATAGNPFFLIETIRFLFERGDLTRAADGSWTTRYDAATSDYAELPLPPTVRAAVLERVERLGAAAIRLLQVASLAHEGCSLNELQPATALAPWEALEGLERAIVAHVIERDGSGYRFTHELVRHAMRSALTPERAQLIHVQLVSALQSSEGSPARVAYHLEQAGQPGAAIEWRVRAAEGALSTYAYREAIDHFGCALADGAPAAQAFEIRDRRIDVMRLAGLRQEREIEAQAMRTLAAALDDPKLRFRATLQSAIVASDFGAMSDMERYALEALRWEAPSAVARIKLHSIAGFAASRLGRRGDALVQYEQAVELSQREQPRNLPTMAASASSAATCVGQLDRARELTGIALSAARMQPGTLFEALALSNTSIARRALGERAAAIAQLQAAVGIAARIGERLHIQAFLANQVEALCEDAQLEPARAALADLATFAATGDAQSRYLHEFASVPVYVLGGQLGAAVAAARSSIALADEADDLSSRRESRFQAAELLWQLGAEEECAHLTDEFVEITGQHGLVAPLELEVLRATADARGQQPERAADRLTAALRAPTTLRVLHWPRDAARVLLGQVLLMLGRPEDARSAVEGVDASVGLEMLALALSVDAGASALRDDARARFDDPDAPPLAALALGAALLRADPASAPGMQERQRAIAQRLADSLAGLPRIQGSFIRLHRDLLT